MTECRIHLLTVINNQWFRINELTNAINGHLRVAQKQADNITELTKLVATQANTVAMLISRTG